MRLLCALFAIVLLAFVIVVVMPEHDWQQPPTATDKTVAVGTDGATGLLVSTSGGWRVMITPRKNFDLGVVDTETEIIRLQGEDDNKKPKNKKPDVSLLEELKGETVTVTAEIEYGINEENEEEELYPIRVKRMWIFFHLDGRPRFLK